MNSNLTAKIVIAETSVIIRNGLTAVVKRMPGLSAYPVEIASLDALHDYFQIHTPDLLIINPTFEGWFDLSAFKAEYGKASGTRYMAVICNVLSQNRLKGYDDCFSVCDEIDVIADKINRLLQSDVEEEKESEQDMLSQREKEIITCVVKGMTNKAIADQLYLSIHTVITHRRNIARKLQIHSPAGLTIYAIVNKLVELQDVKDML